MPGSRTCGGRPCRLCPHLWSFGTPVSAATSFLFSLASNRTKTTFMPILGFIRRPRPQRFGALNMTAALGPWIMRHPDVGGNTEQFLLQFCDARVFERGGVYAGYCASAQSSAPSPKEGLQWSSDEHLNVTSRAVAAALDDPEFPVRAQAARTEMVLLHDSGTFFPLFTLPPTSLRLDLDADVYTYSLELTVKTTVMEVIVEAFQTELLPVAAQLTAGLGTRKLGEVSWDAASRLDDDKTNAAMGVAKTIGTVGIISATDSAPEISVHVQEAIIFISFTLKNNIFDSFDNMYDLLMYNLFEPNAADSPRTTSSPMGATLSRTRPDYQRMLLDVYQTSITSEQLGENDPRHGASTIYFGRSSSPPSASLTRAETAALRLANLEVLINAVLYSPAAALHIMETTQVGFRPQQDAARARQEAVVMALCALLEMAPGAVPESLIRLAGDCVPPRARQGASLPQHRFEVLQRPFSGSPRTTVLCRQETLISLRGRLAWRLASAA
ncbi:hypothetical protein B0H14DRAFT_3540563 [Mycena olivaceomarginata]|nr:hypothetical protein B0H14DRAFT_3540563 [Mycena olivaceomarginata]